MNKEIICLVAFCLVINWTNIHAQDYGIARVEPPFWWTEMQHSELQVLIYGTEIAQLHPQIEYPGVTINKIITVKNANYLFVDLIISPLARPGTLKIELVKNGKVEVSYDFQLLERKEGSAQRKGFDNSDVMYLVTPDRFANGNPLNDTVKGLKEKSDRSNPHGRHGGDLKGIMDHLDYIHDMGFTAIWVNPVLENDQPRYSYHGYSTTDFYKVDTRFGTNEEYKNLVTEAGKNDIKLIMDMILNHCGSEHWWMKDLPTGDWINYGGKFVQTNHKRTTTQDPYASRYDHKRFVDGWFVETMPDLNQRNELLATYLIQNTIWWIEYVDLAGIRMDTYPYPDKDFMTEWTCRVMKEYAGFNIVGEEWSLNPAVVAHWQEGKENRNGYRSCLPGVMDFPLQSALVEALVEKENWNSGLIKLYEMLSNDFLYANPNNLVIFPDNHDMSRIFTQLGEDLSLFKMAMVYILTVRGIPQVYYGTEILMTNPGTESHGIIRSDFPGGWKGDEVNAFEDNNMSKEQVSVKEFLKRILNWRKTATVIHKGKLMHYAPDRNVYVYFRYDKNDQVMVVINKNPGMFELELEKFEERLPNAQIKGTDILTNTIVSVTGKILLSPQSVLLIDLN